MGPTPQEVTERQTNCFQAGQKGFRCEARGKPRKAEAKVEAELNLNLNLNLLWSEAIERNKADEPFSTAW
jgi:hypothetical protein